jgi:hypothetical protein
MATFGYTSCRWITYSGSQKNYSWYFILFPLLFYFYLLSSKSLSTLSYLLSTLLSYLLFNLIYSSIFSIFIFFLSHSSVVPTSESKEVLEWNPDTNQLIRSPSKSSCNNLQSGILSSPLILIPLMLSLILIPLILSLSHSHPSSLSSLYPSLDHLHPSLLLIPCHLFSSLLILSYPHPSSSFISSYLPPEDYTNEAITEIPTPRKPPTPQEAPVLPKIAKSPHKRNKKEPKNKLDNKNINESDNKDNKDYKDNKDNKNVPDSYAYRHGKCYVYLTLFTIC